jgi:hypothetical protein
MSRQEALIQAVCRVYRLTPHALRTARRGFAVKEARKLFCAFALKYIGYRAAMQGLHRSSSEVYRLSGNGRAEMIRYRNSRSMGARVLEEYRKSIN